MSIGRPVASVQPWPVVALPPDTVVLDLTRGPVPPPRWYLGRYDEDRPSQYPGPHFDGRTVHLGLDLGAPAGTSVHAFAPGRVWRTGWNRGPGDYGPTVVVEHRVDPAWWPEGMVTDARLWALYGHLAAASLAASPVGREVEAGDVLGWLGEPRENGGWPPHVHLQLCTTAPPAADLSGVVRPEDRPVARVAYPDPSWLLPEPFRVALRRPSRA